MKLFLIRRILSGVLVLFVVVTIIFFLTRLTGDPALLIAGPEATAQQIAAVRERLGTNQPLWEQYIRYVGGVVRGDLGRSLRWNEPAATVVLERLPGTLKLTALSLGVALLVAIPLGVYSAVHAGSVVDMLCRVVAVLGQCIPVFWLGILLIILFAVNARLLPTSGTGTWKHLILPSLTLSVYTIPVLMRLVRSKMLEVLEMDYVRTARSKGLPGRVVVYKHAFRNALIPVVTVFGLRLGHVISGSIITEEVFAYPGMGRMAIQALVFRDFSVVQAFVLAVAILMVTISLVTDILYAVLDPRIRIT